MRRLLHSLWLLPILVSATFREQSIGAKGFVSCRGVRQPGVFVQLYDEDSIFPFDSDDLMGSTTADGLGHFCVKGTTSEVTDIDPYILIEHNCGYEGTGEKTEFFTYLDKQFIVEGNVSRLIESLGEIELLTPDAPIQDYKKKYYHHRHLHHSQRERIDQCIPLYVTYKDFFEKEVFGTGRDSVKVLEKDEDIEKEDVDFTKVDEVEKEGKVEETVIITKIEKNIEEITRMEKESMQKIEDEARRLEEERLRLEEERKREERRQEEEKREEERLREEERVREEERRREEERLREEERRLEEERRKEEERKREEERRKEEEERQRMEEKRRQEYEKAMEEYRRREEERRLEIQRREEERKKEVVSVVSTKDVVATPSVGGLEEDVDDPCYRRIKRGIRLDANDPCYRRLRG